MSKQFYLTSRHGNCGGTTMFWNKNGKGYGTALDNAELFTLEEAMEYHVRDMQAIPLLKEAVDKAAVLHVDCQHLDKDLAIQHIDGPDEFVIQIDGHWSGNDILFVSEDGHSYDYSKAKAGSWRDSQKTTYDLGRSCTVWPKAFLDTIARRTLEVADINKRAMCSSAGVKLRRPKRQRPTTGKTRKNCGDCGKIVWDYDPHSEVTCRDHNYS